MSNLWLGRLVICCGVTGRGDNFENPPWLGFCYGSWLPVARLHNGYTKSLNWYWLCFHGCIDWWPKGCSNWFWSTPSK